MKIYLEPSTNSRGIMRVRDALIKYAPANITVVKTSKEADLEVIHVYGRYDRVQARIEELNRGKKPYCMIQYCVRSTMKPNTAYWASMWSGARLVWSYYDLNELMKEDGLHGNMSFYYAPLGVDADVFQESKTTGKIFAVAASSQHALSESVRECAFAVKRLHKQMFFLGHELRRGSDIICRSGIYDEQLAGWYSSCEYVSGLRRCEGFELPVIEGALCGARPIVFDRPEMRHWFGDFALFIPEGNREEVIDSLEAIFKHAPKPISEEEKHMITERFNWETIIKGFWERIA